MYLINQINHIVSHYQVEEKTVNNKEHKFFKNKYNEVINSFNFIDTNANIINNKNKKIFSSNSSWKFKKKIRK